jgi:hypothetical protein
MIEDKRINNGGGQGRKPKFNEETTTLAFRVPVSKKEEIKTKVDVILLQYQKKDGI